MAGSKVQQDRPFNMAMIYLSGIQRLIDRYDQAMMEHDIYSALECCYSIYGKITFKLSDTEEDDLEKQLDGVKKYFSNFGQSSAARYAQSNNMQLAKNKIRELYKTLTKLMDKYQLLMPHIDVKTGIDRIHDRYDIQ